MLECPFCDRIEAGDFDNLTRDIISFKPLNPVTPGHRLFLPRKHVKNAAFAPWITANTFEIAAEYARARNLDFNLITSAGEAATQTVPHLHVHYVPRRKDDGLHLPWTRSPLLRGDSIIY